MSDLETKIVIGQEFDWQLGKRLKRVLKNLGASKVDSSWGVVGSQEVETCEYQIGGAKLRVESETYMGLSLTGPQSVIARISVLLDLSSQ